MSRDGSDQVLMLRCADQLISRTWKGIPDCWRAAAWHAFLTSSAEKKGDCLSDEELRIIYQVGISEPLRLIGQC